MIRFPGFHGNSNIYSISRATYCSSRGQVSSTNSSTISQDPMILWIELFWFSCSRLSFSLNCIGVLKILIVTLRNALKMKFKSHPMSFKDRLHYVLQEYLKSGYQKQLIPWSFMAFFLSELHVDVLHVPSLLSATSSAPIAKVTILSDLCEYWVWMEIYVTYLLSEGFITYPISKKKFLCK